MRFEATATIHAPADVIWTTLTQGSAWPEWDPSCERIEGSIAANAKLKVYSKLAPGRAFNITVTEFIPNQTMVWVSGLPLGLFKGTRTFTLKPAADGAHTFTVCEVFTGLLLPVFGRTVPDMSATFAEFAQGLKGRAERDA